MAASALPPHTPSALSQWAAGKPMHTSVSMIPARVTPCAAGPRLQTLGTERTGNCRLLRWARARAAYGAPCC